MVSFAFSVLKWVGCLMDSGTIMVFPTFCLISSRLPFWLSGLMASFLEPTSVCDFEVIGFSVAFINLFVYFLWLYCFRSLDIITRWTQSGTSFHIELYHGTYIPNVPAAEVNPLLGRLLDGFSMLWH